MPGDLGMNWDVSAVTTTVGGTVVATYTATMPGGDPRKAELDTLLGGVATAEVSSGSVTFTGAAVGAVTIPAYSQVGNSVYSGNSITITVTAATDDQNFLNERGLARVWNNIDTLKQDKLTAGTNITISASNTISASQPTVGNATLTIQKNGASAGTFTANATSNKTINITVPTSAADVSALPASTKYGASIAVSINTTDYKVTTTLKDQDGNTLGTAQVIDLPLESVVVNGSYDSTNKKIVLTLQNGNTIDIPVADLVAGLQSEITSTNKLASDLVDDTNQTHKFMTSAEKTKLSGIAAGAEVNVQANWTQTTTTADDYIKNKPTLATVATSGSYNDLLDKPTLSDEIFFINVTSFSGSDGSYTVTVDKTYSEIMSAYQDGKVLIVRADVNSVPDSSFPASSSDYVYAELYHVQETENAGNTSTSFFFAAGETSGNGMSITAHSHIFMIDEQYASYDIYFGSITVTDLISNIANPVSSSAVYNALATKANSADLATVATSGSYNDLSNKPTIPAAQVNSDWNAASGVAQILNKPTLATVATSGSYNDLSNKPTIPTVNNATLTIQKNGTTVKTFTANASSNVTANITVPINVSDLTNDAGYLTSVAWGDVTGKPTFATVATSGSYNDLSNKPTIPTVNNATLTIQKNGTNVQTFSANQSTNATANITVPTKTSDLTNDSGFLDSVAWGDVTGKPTFATVATSGSYNDLSNKPTIPAAQVQSNWTQTTTTAVDYIKNKPTLATVATSGSYNDLSNKPTIPTVGDATLTIQKNGTNVQTFTANATSNKTANITVPTKTSDITNDSGFVSTSDVGTVTGTMIADATVGSDKLTNNAVWTANIKDGAVTSGKIDWTTMAFGNYSTSEQDTKLTWINGAKIYKKTIVSTDLAAGENNINHGISNLGLVLKYDGLMDIGGGTTLPIPTMASVTNNSVSVWIVNSTVIRIFSSLLFTGTVYITLYYTKTS